MRGGRGVDLCVRARTRSQSPPSELVEAQRERTEAEFDMPSADPREDKQAAEEGHDEVLHGFAEERGRVDLANEAGDPSFSNGGAEVERSGLRELEAGEAERW